MASLMGASTAGGTALVAILLEDLYRRLTGTHRWRLRSRHPMIGAPKAAPPIGGRCCQDPIAAIHVGQVRALQVGNGNTQHNILH